MTSDTIDYTGMIDLAMRGVVRDVLRQIGRTGLPGDHHFYISFSTTHPDARMSDQLRSRYPKEITIVLQHQFWDFKIEEHQFHVTLSFGGVPEKLVVPFDALTAFADPSVKFGLQFQHSDEDELSDSSMDLLQDLQTAVSIKTVGPEEDDGSAEIISLDSFRKK